MSEELEKYFNPIVTLHEIIKISLCVCPKLSCYPTFERVVSKFWYNQSGDALSHTMNAFHTFTQITLHTLCYFCGPCSWSMICKLELQSSHYPITFPQLCFGLLPVTEVKMPLPLVKKTKKTLKASAPAVSGESVTMVSRGATPGQHVVLGSCRPMNGPLAGCLHAWYHPPLPPHCGTGAAGDSYLSWAGLSCCLLVASPSKLAPVSCGSYLSIPLRECLVWGIVVRGKVVLLSVALNSQCSSASYLLVAWQRGVVEEEVFSIAERS